MAGINLHLIDLFGHFVLTHLSDNYQDQLKMVKVTYFHLHNKKALHS